MDTEPYLLALPSLLCEAHLISALINPSCCDPIEWIPPVQWLQSSNALHKSTDLTGFIFECLQGEDQCSTQDFPVDKIIEKMTKDGECQLND